MWTQLKLSLTLVADTNVWTYNGSERSYRYQPLYHRCAHQTDLMSSKRIHVCDQWDTSTIHKKEKERKHIPAASSTQGNNDKELVIIMWRLSEMSGQLQFDHSDIPSFMDIPNIAHNSNSLATIFLFFTGWRIQVYSSLHYHAYTDWPSHDLAGDFHLTYWIWGETTLTTHNILTASHSYMY